MKRSYLNFLIADAKAAFRERGWILPPFADFPPPAWRCPEQAELRRAMVGWDVTDFGSGDFERVGLVLFTLRNGSLDDPGGLPYAEKLMLVREGQATPFHFHRQKMEDIINRGGGNLIMRMHESTPEEGLSDAPVRVKLDGRTVEVAAGEELRIRPGSSVTLRPYLYHTFWAERGARRVVVGEVSKVNDDRTDNRFLEPCGRFPAILEDEPATAALVGEYAG